MKNKKLLVGLILTIFAVGTLYGNAEPLAQTNSSSKEYSKSANTMILNIKSSRIPAGTKFPIRIETPLNTVTSNPGDQFNATITQDILVGKDVILPTGTMVRGTVGYIKRASLLSKGAEMLLTFDHVVTSNGKQIPIYAVLTSTSNLTMGGGISSGTSYGGELNKSFDKTKDIVSGATSWGVEKGGSFWGGYPVIVTAPVAATAGAFGGATYFVGKSVILVFSKGGEVIVPQSKIFEIRITQPLDIPVN